MRASFAFSFTIIVCIILSGQLLAGSIPATSPALTTDSPSKSVDNSISGVATAGNYNATLRVYVLEKVSPRWWDFTLAWYKHAMIGFAIDTVISIPYEGTADISATWNGSDHDFGDITESNIMVVAALFNSEANAGDSDPESGYGSFNAYYVDATAEASSGETGSDVAALGYTHTVLIEKATRVGCVNCPVTAAVLNSLYEGGQYNFTYISMVYQSSPEAYGQVVVDYNLQYVPTCYFDGGRTIYIGGSYAESSYTTPMNVAGQRDAADVDLDVTMTWLGGTTLQVDVGIANHQYYNTPPETPAAPAGPATGVSGSEYEFTGSSTDADGHQVYYMWDWGDGETSTWLGPYDSGVNATATHAFPVGSYNVRIKAKDDYEGGDESDWSAVASITLDQRGEANGDGAINVGDAVYLINYIFKNGSAPEPLDMGDANCDQSVNVGDTVYLINYVFKGGNPPGCQ